MEVATHSRSAVPVVEVWCTASLTAWTVRAGNSGDGGNVNQKQIVNQNGLANAGALLRYICDTTEINMESN